MGILQFAATWVEFDGIMSEVEGQIPDDAIHLWIQRDITREQTVLNGDKRLALTYKTKNTKQ